ncbi:MAG: helix-turn-helix domain-containing protein [bacterium]
MNLYEKRLNVLAQTINFLKRTYTPEQLMMWIDIKTDRIGIPQRLWILRRHLNLSLDEFATSLNFAPAEYMKYECIGADVPDSLIERICEKFKIDKSFLRVSYPSAAGGLTDEKNF